MLRLRRLVPFTLALALAACKSSGDDAGGVTTDLDTALANADEVECVCGTPSADIHGCYYSACLLDERNPANPDCTCGALYDAQDGMRQVSYGAGEGAGAIAPREEFIFMASGGSFRATLFGDDGLSIQVRRSSGDEQTIPYDDLAPRTVYRLMKARTANDDANGELELARYAGSHGLYAYSRRHYEQARKLDPSLADEVDSGLAEVRAAAALQELKVARAEIANDKPKNARKHLKNILTEFQGEPAAATAATLLAEIDDTDRQGRERSTQQEHELIQRALKPARVAYEKALQYNHDGLIAKSESRALKAYEKAYKEGERSKDQVEKARAKYRDDAGVQTAAKDLDESVVAVLIDSLSNQASVYMTRRAYKDALKSANTALALDPDNKEIKELRSRIEVAASRSGWGPGWAALAR